MPGPAFLFLAAFLNGCLLCVSADDLLQPDSAGPAPHLCDLGHEAFLALPHSDQCILCRLDDRHWLCAAAADQPGQQQARNKCAVLARELQ